MVQMNETKWARFKRSISSITFEQAKVHLVLLSVQLVFSVFYILGKIALKSMHPFVFLTYRLLLATPIMWLFAFIAARDQMMSLPKGWREWILLIVVGILAVTINQSLFLVGLELSTASNAAITQPAIPIFSTLIGVVMGFEKKTALKFIGIGVSVVGAVLMIDFTHLVSDTRTGTETLLGNLCFLGNTIAYSGFLISQRPLLKSGMSPAKVMAWAFLFGTPIVGIVGAAIVPHGQWAETNVMNWMVLLYTAILATAYTFWMSAWAVKKSDATTVAVYLTIEPLATSIMAAIVLHERLTPLNYVGACVILVGVAAVMFSKHKEKKEELMREYEKNKNNHSAVHQKHASANIDMLERGEVGTIKETNQIVDSSNIYISPDLHAQKSSSSGDHSDHEQDSAFSTPDKSQSIPNHKLVPRHQTTTTPSQHLHQHQHQQPTPHDPYLPPATSHINIESFNDNFDEQKKNNKKKKDKKKKDKIKLKKYGKQGGGNSILSSDYNNYDDYYEDYEITNGGQYDDNNNNNNNNNNIDYDDDDS
ncbi:hypothetical protein DFA_01804 [Cavenderia fasciculata]|uniref:EamA domain-containing protein n=1 Tax=Cavenderia fasciculata TaxID=261658 RepID=F4PUV6_CACFS|nr:uncharacterized protein DFA_01804 [Cavenderia fasciculata]EGG21918.1 hypothetical protein DFA_01804 [Cavenderia fasciculata]|eukprot:XP_004359769.1 hypothetical protein DFA_01804 [Cavenderia fasciculata]